MRGKNVGFGTGRAMMDRGLSKVHRRIALIAVVASLSGAACVNPFSGSESRSPAPSEGSGRLFVTLDNGMTAQTILPDDNLADVIATYDVLLTDPPEGAVGVISHTALDPGTAFPFELSEIKAGTWTLTVHGRNESDEIVASYSGSVTITDGETTAVEVSLRGTQDGTGRLVYTLTWAAGEADDVEVELRSGSYFDPGIILDSSDYTFLADDEAEPPRGQLVVTLEDINSGDHLLIVRLKRESGTNAPVSEAVQIYDHRTSSKTVNLPAGALTQPPAAPENLVVEFIGENLFNIYWTDASTTEEGFRVFGYDLNDPNGAQQLEDDLSAGSTALMNLSAPFTSQELPIDEYTLEVVSFNQFGESDPLALTLRVFPESQLPDFSPLSSSSSNDSSWIALDNPGRLESGTPVVGGADSMDLFISGTDDLLDPFAFPAPTHTGGTLSYDLAELTERSPGATFWWRTQANVGTARIIYPVRQFTFRDGTLYVSTAGQAGAAGSSMDPLGTIQDALMVVEPGETVRIAAGSYDESFEVTTPVTLQGGWNESFDVGPNNLENPTLIGGSNVVPIEVTTGIATRININTTGVVDIEELTIEDFDGAAWSNRYVIRLRGGDLSMRNTEVRSGTADPAEAVGIVVADNVSSLDVQTSVFVAFDSIDNGDPSNAYAVLVQPAIYNGLISISDSTFGGFDNRGTVGALTFNATQGSGHTIFTDNQIEFLNTTVNPRIQAVRAFAGDGSSIAIIEGNTITAVENTNPGRTFGIQVYGETISASALIVGNHVSFDDHGGIVAGIETDTVSPRIANNVVYIEGGSEDNGGDATYPALIRYVSTSGTNNTYHVTHNTLVAADGSSDVPMRGIAARGTGMRIFNNIIFNTGDLQTRRFYSILGDNEVVTFNSTAGGAWNNVMHGQLYVLWLTGFSNGSPEPQVRFDTVANMNIDSWNGQNVDIDPEIDGSDAWRLTASTPLAVTTGGAYTYTVNGTFNFDYGLDRDGTNRPDPPSIGAYQHQ